MTRQLDSTDSLQVDLFTKVEPERAEVPDSILWKINDIQDAIRLCISVSGLLDKQIHPVLGLDKAQFSRMVSGAHNFPANKILPLQEVCGNNVIQRWMALHTGYELKKRQTTLEEENEQLRAELELARRDLAVIREFMASIRK